MDPFLFTTGLIFWTRKSHIGDEFFDTWMQFARPFPGLLLRSVGIPPIGPVTWCWGELGEAEAERAILGILEMAINPSTNPSIGRGTHVRFQGVFLLLTPCRLSLLLDDGCRL